MGLGLAVKLADCELALGELAPFSSGSTAASAAAVALYAAGSVATSCDATPHHVAALNFAMMVPGTRHICSSHCGTQQKQSDQTSAVKVEVMVVHCSSTCRLPTSASSLLMEGADRGGCQRTHRQSAC